MPTFDPTGLSPLFQPTTQFDPGSMSMDSWQGQQQGWQQRGPGGGVLNWDMAGNTSGQEINNRHNWYDSPAPFMMLGGLGMAMAPAAMAAGAGTMGSSAGALAGDATLPGALSQMSALGSAPAVGQGLTGVADLAAGALPAGASAATAPLMSLMGPSTAAGGAGSGSLMDMLFGANSANAGMFGSGGAGLFGNVGQTGWLKPLLSIGSGLYGMSQASNMQSLAQQAISGSSPWTSSGGAAGAGTALSNVINGNFANDPGFAQAQQAAARTSAQQPGGYAASAAANAALNYQNQRIQALSGPAGVNFSPAAGYQTALSGLGAANTATGQALANIGFGASGAGQQMPAYLQSFLIQQGLMGGSK